MDKYHKITIVNNGLSNSFGVSNQLIKIQQNIPSFNFEALESLGNLGAAAGSSVMGSVLGMISGLIETINMMIFKKCNLLTIEYYYV